MNSLEFPVFFLVNATACYDTKKNAFPICQKNYRVELGRHDWIHLLFLAACFIFGVISETLGTTPMPMSGLSIPQKKFLTEGGILRSYRK